MEIRVYKSLDKKHSTFGIVGSYMKWMLAALGVAIVAGLLTGALLGGIVGMLVFIVLGALGYIGVVYVQGKFSERERDKWLASMSLPDVIRFPPVRLDDVGRYRLNVTDGKVDKVDRSKEDAK